MSHLTSIISDLVAGEDRELPRSIDLSSISPDTLDKAWLTIKESLDDSDDDAIVQKTITTVLSDDGQIDEPGTGDPLTAHLYFLLPSDDTLLLEADRYYFYDIKGLSSTGAKKVLEGGRIIVSPPVTLASS